jgi:type IV pilus assembly protein PilP
MKRLHFHAVLIGILVSLLSGCSGDGQDEIKQWMQQTKQQTRAVIPKLAEPKVFVPFAYSAGKDIDPFNSGKLAVALAKWQAQNSKGIRPNLERRREALEQYPLDTVKMVGVLQKTGLAYAVLQIDKVVFQAKVGNYVGQNLGMITAVTDTGIDIKEIIQDASGEWVERKARLELQESK